MIMSIQNKNVKETVADNPQLYFLLGTLKLGANDSGDGDTYEHKQNHVSI